MKIRLLACVSRNYGLGMKDGSLLFNIKGDMSNFKKCTEGTICIQGMKTFQSILSMRGAPLPRRINVILSRNEEYIPQHGEIVFNNVDSILKGIKTMNEDDKDISIIGGSEVYSLMMEHIDEIILTHVSQDVEETEIFYPMELQESLNFIPVHEEEHFDEDSNLAYKFVTYRKKEDVIERSED